MTAPTSLLTQQHEMRSSCVRTVFDSFARRDRTDHCALDGGKPKHEGVIKAHIAGLLRRFEKSFFIRLGSTGVIADWKDGPYGELNPKVWSDIDDIDTLTSIRLGTTSKC